MEEASRREDLPFKSLWTGLQISYSRVDGLPMIENPGALTLGKPGKIGSNCDSGVEIISFELDILGETVRFDINVAQKQVRLSDIAPLARTLSTKLALMVLE